MANALYIRTLINIFLHFFMSLSTLQSLCGLSYKKLFCIRLVFFLLLFYAIKKSNQFYSFIVSDGNFIIFHNLYIFFFLNPWRLIQCSVIIYIFFNQIKKNISYEYLIANPAINSNIITFNGGHCRYFFSSCLI